MPARNAGPWLLARVQDADAEHQSLGRLRKRSDPAGRGTCSSRDAAGSRSAAWPSRRRPSCSSAWSHGNLPAASRVPLRRRRRRRPRKPCSIPSRPKRRAYPTAPQSRRRRPRRHPRRQAHLEHPRDPQSGRRASPVRTRLIRHHGVRREAPLPPRVRPRRQRPNREPRRLRQRSDQRRPFSPTQRRRQRLRRRNRPRPRRPRRLRRRHRQHRIRALHASWSRTSWA